MGKFTNSLGGSLTCPNSLPVLPPGAMFYHKTGWISFWTNDVGNVDDGTTRYVVGKDFRVAPSATGPPVSCVF